MGKQVEIFGAGLAGLLAASQFHDAKIYELKNREDMSPHKALLRFRSPAIGEHLGINFKRVKVRKGIWHKGEFVQPNILLSNLYAQKVSNSITDRSIWNMKEEERWIAPRNIHEILLDRYDSKITYGVACNQSLAEVTISTKPLPDTINSVFGLESNLKFEFESKPITVFTCDIEDCDVYQTVYFPEHSIDLYRASISGNQLIVECIGDNAVQKNFILAFKALGLPFGRNTDVTMDVQKFGKIKPIDDSIRKNILFELTHKHNIYSLGRFAIWKNVVLDEVWQDISVIKKMINGTIYDAARHLRG